MRDQLRASDPQAAAVGAWLGEKGRSPSATAGFGCGMVTVPAKALAGPGLEARGSG